MSTVVHKVTFQKLESVNTPDYDPLVWLINPDHTDAPTRHVRLNEAKDNLELKSEAERLAADEVLFGIQKAEYIEFLRGEFQAHRERRYEIDTLLYAQYLLYQAAINMNEDGRVGGRWRQAGARG